MNTLDSHTRLNALKTSHGINNNLCSVLGSYQKSSALKKTLISFDIHVKADLIPYMSIDMDIDKAWQTWLNFKDRAYGQLHLDKVIDHSMNIYAEKGLSGLIEYIYYKNRKNRKGGTPEGEGGEG